MNIKNAKIYVENFRRRFVEQQEELSNLQSEIKAVAETIINAKQNGEEEFSSKEILDAVFAALDEWATINDEDLTHVRNLFYQLAKRGDIDNLAVDSDDEDTEESDSENIISEYLTPKHKRILKKAIAETVRKQVQRKLREQEEPEINTSRGSHLVSKEDRDYILGKVQLIISQNVDEEIDTVFSAINSWMESFLRTSSLSRNVVVEIIDDFLTSIGLNEEDDEDEEYAESFSNFGAILKEEYKSISQRMLD